MLVVNYKLEDIDFRPWARSTLSVERLEDLHLRPDPARFANYVERLQYYTRLLTENFEPVCAVYIELVNRIAPLFEGVVLRQIPPSFRCHLVGAGTASAFHRDGDANFNITPGAINAWVPLTPVGGNNSIQIESAVGSEIYRPVSLQPGELLIFDAFHLRHGSYGNDTGSTRISFDFRFLPKNPGLARALGVYAAEPRS